MDLSKYLFLPHEYGVTDCISLLKRLYAEEFGIDLDLPEYPKSRKWMTRFTTNDVDEWAQKYATKVSLTEANNYDLMVFKADRSNSLMHFALYIDKNKMLHIEEGDTSRIELLSSYWVDHLYAVYRHERMVL